MRFKKLRITLGVILIVFILFVGNVIAFGKFLNEVKTDDTVYIDSVVNTTQEQKNISIENKTVVKTNVTKTNITATNKTIVTTNKTVTTPVQPKPVVVVKKKKTRAS